MFEMKEELLRSHLAVRQSRRYSGEHSLQGDLLILVSSWEGRCLEALQVRHGRYHSGALFRFSEQGQSGRRPAHDKLLLGGLQALCDNTSAVEQRSVQAFAQWRDQIVDLFVSLKVKLGRPIDLVLDTSCLPKYYLLIVLGVTLKLNLARSIKILYAEGRYSARGDTSMLSPEHKFTLGGWKPLPVPFLEGQLSPNRRTRLITDIGFETFQARSFISAYEAEKHILVVPQPSLVAEYEDRSRAETEALASYLDLASSSIVRCHAGSAIQVCEQVVSILDSSHQYTDIGLCLGTKPHALGMGLAALIRPYLTLVCRIPEEYAETETPASGKMWLYELTDLSLPQQLEAFQST